MNERSLNRTARLAILALGCFSILSCPQPLELREYLQQKVAAANVAASPLITISLGDAAVANAGTADIGSAVVGTQKDAEFTVSNPGNADLILNGNPGITGTNASEFSIQALSATTVVGGSTATYVVRFAPVSVGIKTATITISSNAGAFAYSVTATATAAPAPRMTLWDGTTQIAAGGSVTWPAAIYAQSSSKTITIKNDGTSNLSLSGGPNYVAIAGGAGQAAYGPVSQPATLVLVPGASSTFSATFTPPTADADYPVDFVINSNDPVNPAFVFHGSGHSTQWHGSLKVATSTVGNIFSPRVAIDGSTIYLSYQPPSSDLNAIALRTSMSGGQTWTSTFGGGQAANAPYPHFLQVSTVNGYSEPHILYYSSGSPTLYYTKYCRTSWQLPIQTISATAADATGMVTADLLLNTYVFLTWYNSASSSLYYNWSLNPFLTPPTYATLNSNFLSTPIQLTGTGSSYGLTGGAYHSTRRDSLGNLFVIYYNGSRIGLITAAPANLNFATAPNTYLGPADTVINQVSAIVTESSGITTIHVVYSKGLNSSELYYTRTTSSNYNTWLTPVSLSENNRFGKRFAFEKDAAGILYILHQSSIGTTGVVLTKSSDGGNTWGSQALDSHASYMDPTYKFPASMALAVSGSNVYAFYTTDGETGNLHPNGYSLTLMKSIDGGATW
jgi:hypothetical protein